MINEGNKSDAPSIRDLYPGHTDEWYAEAEANLERYLQVIIRIVERLRTEGKHLINLD